MDGYLKEQVYLGLLAMSGGKFLDAKLDAIEQAVERVIEVPPTVEMEERDERG